MFDLSWTELLVLGVVALIAIGPKELPGALRALGHWMGKVRRMASEFQSQFNEAHARGGGGRTAASRSRTLPTGARLYEFRSAGRHAKRDRQVATTMAGGAEPAPDAAPTPGSAGRTGRRRLSRACAQRRPPGASAPHGSQCRRGAPSGNGAASSGDNGAGRRSSTGRRKRGPAVPIPAEDPGRRSEAGARAHDDAHRRRDTRSTPARRR